MKKTAAVTLALMLMVTSMLPLVTYDQWDWPWSSDGQDDWNAKYISEGSGVTDDGEYIEIWDADDLALIGNDPAYPLDANYVQMAHIIISEDYTEGGFDLQFRAYAYTDSAGMSVLAVELLYKGSIAKIDGRMSFDDQVFSIDGGEARILIYEFRYNDPFDLAARGDIVTGDQTNGEYFAISWNTSIANSTSRITSDPIDSNGNFHPIGVGGFVGTYNGNGYFIDNLHISDAATEFSIPEGMDNSSALIPDSWSVALFPYLLGTVSNVTVSGTVVSSGGVAAGIVGYAGEHSMIITCVSNMDVTVIAKMQGMAAGIVGVSDTIVVACENNGRVSAYSEILDEGDSHDQIDDPFTDTSNICMAAGITVIGNNVISCRNTGEVTSGMRTILTGEQTFDETTERTAMTGGIAVFASRVKGCVNDGKVVVSADNSFAAGITVFGDFIDQCENNGEIKAWSPVYDIIGSNVVARHSSTKMLGGIAAVGNYIADSINTAKIVAEPSRETFAGGIAAMMSAGYGLINEGDVQAFDSEDAVIGGIAGIAFSLIGAENTGIVESAVTDGRGTTNREYKVAGIAAIFGGAHMYTEYEGNAMRTMLMENVRIPAEFAMTDCHNSGNVLGYDTVCGDIGNMDVMTYAGGISAFITDADVTGCTNNGSIIAATSISGTDPVNMKNLSVAGGILGYAYRTSVSYCINTAEVGATVHSAVDLVASEYETFAGGIVGFAYSVSMEYCKSTKNGSVLSGLSVKGDFTASVEYRSLIAAGGLIGYVYDRNGISYVRSCYNETDMEARIFVEGEASNIELYSGGLVGMASGGLTVAESWNAGEVKVSTAGGDTSTLTNVYLDAGGILNSLEAAYTEAATVYIRDSYVTGDVILELEVAPTGSSAGGIVGMAGDITMVIQNCYFAGELTAEDIGGIIGYTESSDLSIYNCYYLDVSGTIEIVTGLGTMGDDDRANISIDGLPVSIWDDDTDKEKSGARDADGIVDRSTYRESSTSTPTNERYDGWLFDATWAIDDGNAAPFLRSVAGVSAQSQYGVAGWDSTFTAYAGSASAEFHWEISTDGGETWEKVDGSDNGDVTFTVTEGNMGDMYRTVTIIETDGDDILIYGEPVGLIEAAGLDLSANQKGLLIPRYDRDYQEYWLSSPLAYLGDGRYVYEIGAQVKVYVRVSSDAYYISEITVNGEDAETRNINGYEYLYLELEGGITEVGLMTERKTLYNVYVSSDDGADVQLESEGYEVYGKHTVAEQGDIVYLSISVYEDFELDAVKVNGNAVEVRRVGVSGDWMHYELRMTVTSDMTVEVSTTPVAKYKVTAGVIDNDVRNDGGSISASADTAYRWEPVTFTFTADHGCAILEILVNGTPMDVPEPKEFDDLGNAVYEITLIITEDTEVTVEYMELPSYDLNTVRIKDGQVLWEGMIDAFYEGTEVIFYLYPDDGYRIKEVTVNGEQVDYEISYDIPDDFPEDFLEAWSPFSLILTIRGDTTLTTEYVKLETYTVTPSVADIGIEGNGGTIWPNTPVQAYEGVPTLFTFIPDDGYGVKEVTINGEAAEPDEDGYWLIPSEDATITVEFAKLFDVNIRYVDLRPGLGTYYGGHALYDATALDGDMATVHLVPDTGYKVGSVAVNGVDVTHTVTDNVLRVGIRSDITVTVEFAPGTAYAVTSMVKDIGVEGNGGTISFTGTATVFEGDSITYTVSPADGYEVRKVTVNGSMATVIDDSFTVSVSADTEVTVEFGRMAEGTEAPVDGDFPTAAVAAVAVVAVAALGIGAFLFLRGRP